MPVLAAGPWELFFERGAEKQKKKKKKKSSPPSRGTARVLLVRWQQKEKNRRI